MKLIRQNVANCVFYYRDDGDDDDDDDDDDNKMFETKRFEVRHDVMENMYSVITTTVGNGFTATVRIRLTPDEFSQLGEALLAARGGNDNDLIIIAEEEEDQ